MPGSGAPAYLAASQRIASDDVGRGQVSKATHDTTCPGGRAVGVGTAALGMAVGMAVGKAGDVAVDVAVGSERPH